MIVEGFGVCHIPCAFLFFLFWAGWLGRKDEENYDGHDDCTRTVMCAR